MRTVLVCILALIFVIVIVFPACDKSTDIDTDKPPEDNLLCGDAFADGVINLIDVTAIISYLALNGELTDAVSAEADNIKGITINDAVYLVFYLYKDGNPPNCSFNLPDTVLPVSADTVIISAQTVPPGVNKWKVDLSLKATNVIKAISFPFHYDCPGSGIICDSIVHYKFKKALKTTNFGLLNNLLKIAIIDTANQLGLILRGNLVSGFPTDSALIASIWFSLTPSVDTQTIVIDTTTFPPSNIVIMSRFEYPETIASVPVIIFK